jgi:omega-6 fatty acid desaturase (delta-12 desaturase)
MSHRTQVSGDPSATDNSLRTFRDVMKQFHLKSNALAVALFSADTSLYIILFLVGALSPRLSVKVLAGILCGVITARLFVIGHDACHQSFTSNRILNRWIGRLAFAPSLTPYGSWELAHNSIHHVFSNWSEKDYVWAPFSRDQYRSLPWWRKTLEHCYRTPPGQGLYYFIQIWCTRLYFPRKKYARKSYVEDSIFVTLVLLARVSLLVLVARIKHIGILPQLLTLELLPFAVWNALMGFTIFLHHTHPSVPWFRDRDEWVRYETQLQSPVHVSFPIPFSRFFHNIMEHTAHHVDINIPLYRLPKAQITLEKLYPQNVVVDKWSVRRFLASTRICKLYDYETHCWTDFRGNVTARTTFLRT